jgi:hypothetical protein
MHFEKVEVRQLLQQRRVMGLPPADANIYRAGPHSATHTS